MAVLWHGTWLPVACHGERQEVRTILPACVLQELGFHPPRAATEAEQQADYTAGRPVRLVRPGGIGRATPD